MSEEQQTPPARPVSDEVRLELAKTQHTMSRFKGVAPDDPINKIVAFCETVLGASYIPEACRNSMPNLFFLVSVGQDLGLKWTHTLRSMFLTPAGKVGMQGDIMLALLFQNKFKVKILETTKESAEYFIQRPGGPDEFSWSCKITWEQAVEAGWPYYYKDGKQKLRDPWKDQANMLRWRSLAFTARVVAADLLGGTYLPEELDSIGMEENGQGVYVSARESAEREADKVAEADPGLKLVKKSEVSTRTETKAQPAETNRPAPETVPAKTAVVDVKAETTVQPSAQELRNEAFLKRQANQNAAEHGITDDDLPRLDEGATVSPEAKAQSDFRARIGAFMQQYGGTMQTWVAYATSFLGDPVKVREVVLLNDTMDKLETAFSQYPAAVKNYIDDPKAFAKNVITALSMAAESTAKPSGPVAVPDKAPATRKPRETRQRAEPPPPPPPPPPVEDDQPSVNPLDKVLPKEWSAVTCDLALDAMRARALTEERFISTMHAFSILFLKDEDALAFFEMYYHAPDSVLLVKRAAEKNRSMSSVLELLEKEFLKKSLGHDTPTADAIKAVQNTISEVISL